MRVACRRIFICMSLCQAVISFSILMLLYISVCLSACPVTMTSGNKSLCLSLSLCLSYSLSFCLLGGWSFLYVVISLYFLIDLSLGLTVCLSICPLVHQFCMSLCHAVKLVSNLFLSVFLSSSLSVFCLPSGRSILCVSCPNLSGHLFQLSPKSEWFATLISDSMASGFRPGDYNLRASI